MRCNVCKQIIPAKLWNIIYPCPRLNQKDVCEIGIKWMMRKKISPNINNDKQKIYCKRYNNG